MFQLLGEATPTIPTLVDFATWQTAITGGVTAVLVVALGYYFGGAIVRKGIAFITGGIRKV